MLMSQPEDTMTQQSPASRRPVAIPADEAERNRLLAEMAEQSTDMISRHTPGEWRFIYASPAVTHLLGYSVEEIIGMSAYELYHPDDVEDFKRRSPSVSYERGLYTHTYRFRCRDGHYTWLESTSRSIRDPDSDELLEILVVSRDVSRRVEAEQASRRLARVLEYSSDLVAFATPDHRVTQLNEAARQILGAELSDHQPMRLQDLFPADSYALLQNQGLPLAIEEGRWRGEAAMFSRSQQRLIPVMLEVLAHRSLDGQLEYFSTVARDMTAVKQAEADKLQYQLEIDHAGRLITMGEMATSLAHEVNQPLTAVVNYVRGIQRMPVDASLADIAQPLERIASTALRAGDIVHRMMDFTRKTQPRRELLDLTPLVDELISFCQHTAGRYQVQLANRLPAELPAVMADRIQLEQILLNLILNGIEACREVAESDRRVWLDASLDKSDQVIIRVLDQGSGLPADDPEQLFGQFYTTKADGLGMGLAISRTLAERQGGQLQGANRPEGGAVFSFNLSTG